MGIDLGKCLSDGFEDLTRNPLFTIVGFLVITLVNGLTCGLIAGPLIVGFWRGIEKDRAGGRAEIGDIFSAFDRFLPSFLVSLLGGLAAGIGSLLCIIPGLLIAPIVPIGLYLVHRGETDGLNALSRAFEILKANLWMAALTTFILYLVGSLGVLLCYVGMLASMPITLGGLFTMAQQAERNPA